MKSRLHHGSNGRRTHRVCVQVVGQGIPIRVSREDAHRLVAIDHDAQYCKKSVWRKYQANSLDLPEGSLIAPFCRIDAKGKIVAADL